MTNREKLNSLNNKDFADYVYSVFASGKLTASRQAMGVPLDKSWYEPNFFPKDSESYEKWLEEEIE